MKEFSKSQCISFHPFIAVSSIIHNHEGDQQPQGVYSTKHQAVGIQQIPKKRSNNTDESIPTNDSPIVACLHWTFSWNQYWLLQCQHYFMLLSFVKCSSEWPDIHYPVYPPPYFPPAGSKEATLKYNMIDNLNLISLLDFLKGGKLCGLLVPCTATIILSFQETDTKYKTGEALVLESKILQVSIDSDFSCLKVKHWQESLHGLI